MGGWTFILRQVGDQYFIGVGEQNGQGTKDKLAVGSKVLLMLASGNTVEIVTTKEYESTPLQLGSNMFSQWIVCEPVPKATLAKLSESPITALKTAMTFRGEHREFVLPGIKERQSERIMTTAACMLANNQ